MTGFILDSMGTLTCSVFMPSSTKHFYWFLRPCSNKCWPWAYDTFVFELPWFPQFCSFEEEKGYFWQKGSMTEHLLLYLWIYAMDFDWHWPWPIYYTFPRDCFLSFISCKSVWILEKSEGSVNSPFFFYSLSSLSSLSLFLDEHTLFVLYWTVFSTCSWFSTPF